MLDIYENRYRRNIDDFEENPTHLDRYPPGEQVEAVRHQTHYQGKPRAAEKTQTLKSSFAIS